MFDYLPKLKSIEEFKTLKEQDKITVFLFSAPWCKDCIFLNTFFKDIVDSYPNISFIYVNRDEYLDICEALQILGIPSFVAYKNNKEINRFVSTLRKSKEEVIAFLNKLN